MTAKGTEVHERFGWTALFVALAFGAAIEGLHGIKASSYLLDPLRREMWSLAHFHAVGLAIVNIVYAVRLDQRAASWSLIAGSVLMPVGFLLGGVGHYESDPGVGIMLAPVGAALVLFAVGARALDAWRGK